MNKIISGSFTHSRLIERRGKMWIVNKEEEVQFNKDTIEEYEILDEVSTTTSNTTTRTKGKSRKSTTSMAGRAIVGGAIFGPVGAVVGAATAKNKNRSVSNGITTEKTTRNFKVLVSFVDGRDALLQLDERGYENFLSAAYAEPYEIVGKSYKMSGMGFLKFMGFLIYLRLLTSFPIPILILTIAYIGWWNYKRISKNKNNKNSNGTSM